MKIVYFDIDQTLLRANEKTYEEIRTSALEKLGLPYESLEKGKKFVKTISKNYNMDEEDVQEDYNNAAKEFFENNDISNYINVYDGVVEMLEQLYDSNEIKIGIISNGDSDVQRKKIKALENFFDENLVIISEDVDARKPDEKIYEIAKTNTNVDANNIFFVDDDAKNVEGAKKVGFVGILSKWSESANNESDRKNGYVDNNYEKYDTFEENGIYIALKPIDVVKIINNH